MFSTVLLSVQPAQPSSQQPRPRRTPGASLVGFMAATQVAVTGLVLSGGDAAPPRR